MNRNLLLLISIGLFLSCSHSKKNTTSKHLEVSGRLLFYNVENLFDTLVQDGYKNEEYSPGTEKNWNTKRYYEKLEHLAKVISAADTGYLPNLIGLAEVENKRVVSDLINQPLLAKAGYQIIHQDSPDSRGIDVALVHDYSYKPLTNAFYPILIPGDRPTTRDLLYSKGLFKKDTLHVFVNHWPSRYGGKKESDPKREKVARFLRSQVDSILSMQPKALIIIMGDFNDYPPDHSLLQTLKADSALASTSDLVNLAWKTNRLGEGSYNYRGDWGTLDQFIVSAALFSNSGVSVNDSSFSVVKKPWMLYVNDKDEAYPSRTYGGPNYYGGYSDHLPVLLKLYSH